ncbi:hypothetical protein H5410_006442 [Solanum commersonii]|uniref:Uncharacterized protein n=1 Tax=Solanum commersonii TaxID=4109 RepID=A0A9J6A9U9_SOLCO|nr:hypothetical protein H5410_006442 [Solanum commersonii]
MAFSTISYPIIINFPSRKCRMINKKLSQVRAQSNKDEGLELLLTTTTSTCHVKKHKKKIDYVSQIVEFFFMVICGTLSVTILGCTLCLAPHLYSNS